MSSRCSAVLQAVHHTIARELRRVRTDHGAPMALLDVGCWDGASTAAYREVLGGQAHGVEVFPGPAEDARRRGIEVAELDLETDLFPWADGSMDVVVVNQVFEHLKNVWHAMSEVARVVRPGGWLVFSVPNLASLHNRVMLAAGHQPSSIRTFGPHIRGYTMRQARAFVAHEGFFRVVRTVGVGFYPLPASLGAPAARLWPGASHTPVLVAQRVAPAGAAPPWNAYARAESVGDQTHY